MSQQSDTRLMPAQNFDLDHTLTGSGSINRGEVKAMAKIWRKRTRAWDEMSEIDRAVLLESVRQRREQREQQRKLAEQLGNRVNR